jgi:hypothetical protein
MYACSCNLLDSLFIQCIHLSSFESGFRDAVGHRKTYETHVLPL